jgi:phage terminase large subunit-like protein
VAATGGVFEAGMWDRLAVADPPVPSGARALAVDVNPARTTAVIAAAADLGDGKVLVEVLREDKGVDWVVPALVELRRLELIDAVVIDAASQGRTLISDLRAAHLPITTTDVKGMTDASAAFFDAVVEVRLMHLDQPVLNIAVANATQRTVGDAWAWARRAPRADITPLVAASLAMYGVQHREETHSVYMLGVGGEPGRWIL